MGFECVKPQGAFYLFMKSPEADEKAFVEHAKKIPSAPCGCLELWLPPGYVRIAYCVSYDMICRSLPAFRQLAQDLFRKKLRRLQNDEQLER